jgi:asparagine synthase (glutamine-hydrolysing)
VTGSLPAGLRRGVAAALGVLAWAAAPLDVLSPGRDGAAFRIRRFAWRASSPSVDALRRALMSGPPVGARAEGALLMPPHAVPPAWLADPLDRMMYADQADYLPDDILVKVDRASMHWSLETRIPLLDHRLVEFAWALPRSLVFDRHGGKPLLKRLLAKYVPPALTERPKKGFDVPLAAWLRAPLRPWAESLLAQQRLDAVAVLDAGKVQRAWRDHVAGRTNAAHGLWSVLMLLAWQERTGAGA